MIFGGFRITPAPGQAPALLATVGRVNKIVEKHGGKAVANFTVAFGGPGAGDILYIFGYKDWEALGASGEALQADTEWQQLIAQDGTKVASLSSSILQPLPESAIQ